MKLPHAYRTDKDDPATPPAVDGRPPIRVKPLTVYAAAMTTPTRPLPLTIALLAAPALAAAQPAAPETAAALPTTQPATRPAEATTRPAEATTRPAARPPEAIAADLDRVSVGLNEVLGDPDQLTDDEARAAVADDAVPLLRELRSLLGEAAEAGMVPPNATGQADMLLVVFGDQAAIASLEADAGLAEGQDDPQAVRQANAAAATLIAGRYLDADDDGTRMALLDDFTARAEANPDSEELAQAAALMSSMPGGLEPRRRIVATLAETLTVPGAGDMAQAIGEQVEAQARREEVVGQAVVVESTTVRNEPFTTADLVGKVVLLDLYAGGSAEAAEALPGLLALKETHGEDLAIVGVSVDPSPQALKAFLFDHPEADWVQLFPYDAQDVGVHPVMRQFGVQQVPTRIVLDREGVVQLVTQDDDYEAKIAELIGG